uniref:Uncharacterized protein n=1 Tax=Cacopsylla melanoneura TaxID=428564 RepID=A0A8D8SD98_9HEMI
MFFIILATVFQFSCSWIIDGTFFVKKMYLLRTSATPGHNRLGNLLRYPSNSGRNWFEVYSVHPPPAPPTSGQIMWIHTRLPESLSRTAPCERDPVTLPTYPRVPTTKTILPCPLVSDILADITLALVPRNRRSITSGYYAHAE